MIDVLYVVPCKIDNEGHLSSLKKCIESIKKFINKNEKIFIVDSNSFIKYHFDDNDIIIADKINLNYEIGALLYAYENVHANQYLLIHDSCQLLDNIKDYKNFNISVYNYVDDWTGCDELLEEKIKEKILLTKWKIIPKNFKCIIGSIMLIENKLLKIFYDEFKNILPNNKYESMVFERLFGIGFKYENFENDFLNNKKLPIIKNYLRRQ